MYSNKGWVKLHRKLLENPISCKDADHLAIWVYLLLNAAHDGYSTVFEGKRITLLPGQLVTGRKSISQKLAVSESKVQRILKAFEIERQIEQQTSNKNRLITVVNWREYQTCEQPINNKRTINEQPLNTNKNVKNSKNLYGDFFETLWVLYPIKKGKAAVSESQKKKLHAIGYDEIKRAIERYCAECTDPKFMKHGSTFFNGGYLDYLDASYEQTAQQANGAQSCYRPVELPEGWEGDK